MELSRPVVAAENDVNGSVASWEGETRGVGSADGIALELPDGWRFAACLADLLEDGDANRDRVFKKLDFRLAGGPGRVETSIGSVGSLATGYESRSLW